MKTTKALSDHTSNSEYSHDTYLHVGDTNDEMGDDDYYSDYNENEDPPPLVFPTPPKANVGPPVVARPPRRQFTGEIENHDFSYDPRDELNKKRWNWEHLNETGHTPYFRPEKVKTPDEIKQKYAY